MAEWWEDYPWRLIQTNLRQIDMKDINADQFVRDLQSFDATVLLFNAAGIIANYVTDLDYEPENEYLTGDSTAKIIERCHEAGIRVIARTDFSKVRKAVYEKHPDWAFRNADGNIVNYNGDVHVCPNGSYQQDYMFRIIKDMFARLSFDGIFYNMGGFQTRDYSNNYHGLCHCKSCGKKFRERFGLEIPLKEDSSDPSYRKHRIFQRECIEDLNRRLTTHVRAIGSHIAINNLDYQRIESNTEIGRPLPLWQYSASSNTRNSHQPGSNIRVSNTSVDFLGFPYRHVAVSPWLQELRLWQNIANGGNVDYYLMGRLDNHGDKSGYAHIRKVFRYARDSFEELKNLKSEARVALFHKTHWDDDPEGRGWIRTLSESHIPLDEIQLEFLASADQLKQYKLVILPDLLNVSDAQAAVIDQFAEQGGVVLATGESALYDENFERRPGMPLRCMGIEEIQYHRKDMLSAMLLVDKPEDKKVFPHLATTVYIALGHEFIFVRPNEKAKTLLHLVPPQMYGPPERCYSTEESDLPGFTVFEHGKGKGVHIPFKPGSFFYKEGHLNTAWFMRDILEQVCGAESIAPDLTPMVETTLASQSGRMVVQLVNISGHYGNSYFEPVEIRNIYLKIPAGDRKISELRTLRSGEKPDYRHDGSYVKFTLPCLKEYEAVILST